MRTALAYGIHMCWKRRVDSCRRLPHGVCLRRRIHNDATGARLPGTVSYRSATDTHTHALERVQFNAYTVAIEGLGESADRLMNVLDLLKHAALVSGDVKQYSIRQSEELLARAKAQCHGKILDISVGMAELLARMERGYWESGHAIALVVGAEHKSTREKDAANRMSTDEEAAGTVDAGEGDRCGISTLETVMELVSPSMRTHAGE